MQPECAAAAYVSARRRAAVAEADAAWVSARCAAKSAEAKAMFPVAEATRASGAWNKLRALTVELNALTADHTAATETMVNATRRFAAADDALAALGPAGQQALAAHRDALLRIKADEERAEALFEESQRDPLGLVRRGVQRRAAQ
jgi:hypothetical protein